MRKHGLFILLLISLIIAYIIHFRSEENNFMSDRYIVEAQVIDKIISENISDDMSQYDKVKTIHDYIVNNTEYDQYNLEHNSIPDIDYTAKGVLENNIGVCRGYAEAFKLLMDNLDIECDILTGSSNNISHAWNVVKIDDEWYQIDCTFDDPVSTDDIIENNLRYDYFLITDEQMYIDHLPDANTYTCTSDKYMYQEKQADVPYHILDSVYQLSTSISYLYDKGYKKVTFYFPENATIAENIINDDIPISLGHIKGINQFSYTPVNKCGKYYYTTITVS